MLKSLDKEPGYRYSSADEMEGDLERWLSGEAVLARSVGTFEKCAKWMRRKPMLASLWAMGFLFILTLGIGGPLLALRMSKLRSVAEESARLEMNGRILAPEQAEENRRQLYYADMNLASHVITQKGSLRNLGKLIQKWVPSGGEEDLRGWEWYYLNTTTYREMRSFGRHNGLVFRVAWSPDGTRVASVNKKGKVHIWNVVSDEKPLILETQGMNVKSIAWNPDGSRLLAGGHSGTVRVWDITSGETILKQSVHEGEVVVAWSRDGLRIASGGEGKFIRISKASDGTLIHSIPTHSDQILSLDWSPDNKRLVFISSGGDVFEVWNADSDEITRELETGLKRMRAVAWSPDGRMLASEAMGNSIVIWDTFSWEKRLTLKGHELRVVDLEWSGDNRRLATASWDSTVQIWDVPAGKLLSLISCRQRAHSISWSPDGQRLACATGARVAIFDANREEAKILGGSGSGVQAVQWNNAGNRLLSVDNEKNICIWNTEGEWQPKDYAMHGTDMIDAVWSPDNTRVAAASNDGTILILDAETGEKIQSWKGHQGKIQLVTWSPEGERLASAGDDGMVRIWDSSSASELASWEGQSIRSSSKFSLAWHPEGKWLASPGQSGSIQLRDTNNL